MRESVLVAEDSKLQAEILGRYLQQEGYAVRIVHDGRAAIDEVRRDPPDLLLLDVMMPKVDGWRRSSGSCRRWRTSPAGYSAAGNCSWRSTGSTTTSPSAPSTPTW